MLVDSINDMGRDAFIWIGIVFCLSQSAMFSGLNLAFFSLSRLRLEVEAASGHAGAARILSMRRDSNFLLTTILWGNVGINVLLTLLSNSVMIGLSAFLFSTILITLLGEILPQAYFSRNALRIATVLSPILRFYQIILYPIAKPIAVGLDRWLGDEGIQFYRERDLREVIRKHIDSDEAEIERLEGVGALNFLSLDDLPIGQEGNPLDPRSIVQLPFAGPLPTFPEFERTAEDPFMKKINQSGRGWVIFTDGEGEPQLVCDADRFLREALFGSGAFHPWASCHRPIVVRDAATRLGDVIPKLNVQTEYVGDNVIDNDVILLWSSEKRLIAGADILGRLLDGTIRTSG